MFKISSKQLAACAEVSTQSFADKVTRHLASALPSEIEKVGVAAIQDMVQRGVERAASLGITAKKDVCLFLAAGAALAGEIGAEPDLSRFADLLGPESPLDAAAKVQQLWSIVEEEVLPDAADEGAEPGAADASVAIAVELADAARGALASALPVQVPVVPCPIRPRFYPFSL